MEGREDLEKIAITWKVLSSNLLELQSDQFLVSLVFLLQVSLVSSFVLLCYYLAWSEERVVDIDFYPESIDPFLCSHLVYSDASETADMSLWKDDDLYQRFNDLKKKNKNLKTLMGYGGWAFDSSSFSDMAAQQNTRTNFINSTIDFLRSHGFDGLDLDWRFPAFEDSPASDKEHFTLLVKDLKEAFEEEAKETGKERLLLTAPVAAKEQIISSAYEIPEISKYLDLISVMTYDFHGVQDNFTGHHSPLHPGSADNKSNSIVSICAKVEHALKYWRDKGAAAEKLLVGFPAFGNTYKLSTSQKDLAVPAFDGGSPGPYSGKSGFLAYQEICAFLKDASLQFINDQMVPYAFKGNEWLGYDDQKSFKTKAQWVKDNKFGGAMLWALDLDDYNGTHCAQGVYPLTNTLKSVLDIKFTGYIPLLRSSYEGPSEPQWI
ncbi:acidic mammalian chitinase-like [Rhincodon typus]|uniref:acidic mammalian chitinase-like n=1 Tax=Rhincodon typus TaxID=259920 RepID=UPI00202FBB4D|nr:acidic mammalian chitinase-like [Rhincodon typus]